MFGLRPKLPVTDEDRQWVDAGFLRLSRALGEDRMRQCTVILPTDQFFPDPFDRSEASLESIFCRVCGYMNVDRDHVELAVIPDSSELREMLPEYSHSSSDPAGLHFGKDSGEKPLVGVRQSLLKDPLTLIATIAHELGHVILLDGGRLSREAEYMEPMTDLATVYLGLGVFSANAARRFVQYQDDRKYGWSMSRHGYVPEEVYGYALALFARGRGEINPPWAAHLCTNVRTYFRQSAGWLDSTSRPMATSPSRVK